MKNWFLTKDSARIDPIPRRIKGLLFANSKSLINGSNEMQECESLRLSHGRWIEDGALKSCHVAYEEVMCESVAHLILI